MSSHLFEGFWGGIGSGLSILFPLFLLFVLGLWLALPFLLMRQNRILLEIRDLLRENSPQGLKPDHDTDKGIQ